MKRLVASVEEHPRGSGRYRVRARINGRLRTFVSGMPKAEADAAAVAFQDVKATTELKEGVTLAGFGIGFLDRRERAGIRGIKHDRNRWRLYVAERPLGKLPVGTLRRRDVLEWLDGLSGLAHQTRKNALNLLRVALQEAVDRELLESNPARDVKVHRAGAAKETDDLEGILSPEEQTRLLAAVPDVDRPAVAFALYAGVRQSSQWNLRRADCHAASVFLRRHKSGKAQEHHLLSPAVEALSASLARGSDWAFPAHRGGRRHAGTPPRGWHRWVKAAGIRRRVRWHDLRHTCATSLLAGWWGNRKWSLDEVCRYMGHSSVKVTERYARKLAETQRNAVAETVFPTGNAGGNTTAEPLASAALCKTVIRRFESDPRLSGKPAESVAVSGPDWEHGGNTHTPGAWVLAFAAERLGLGRVAA